MVRGPTLPMNMVRTIIVLLNGHKSGVMPVDKPTVPNAETTSKSSEIKLLSGSKMQRINVDTQTTEAAKVVMIKAVIISSRGRRLL